MNPIAHPYEFLTKRRMLSLLLLLCLLTGLGAVVIYRGALGRKERTDLTVFIAAAQTLREGNHQSGLNMYSTETKRHWHYIYLPLLAVLLAPFANLPLSLNVFLWYLLSIVATWGALRFSSKLGRDPPKDEWKIFLAVLCCLPSFLNTLARGQLGMLTVFFAFLILFLLQKEKKILCGVVFAFAVVLKTSPLAWLGFYFLIRREWKILASAVLGSLFFIFIFPLLGMSWEWNLRLIGDWIDRMQLGSSDLAYQSPLWVELFTLFARDNQSLFAVLTRLIWPDEATFIGHSNAGIRYGVLGILFLSLFLIARLRGNKNIEADPQKVFAEFSLFPMLMLFTAPITQIHHYTVLYLLILAALYLRDEVTLNSFSNKVLSVGIFVSVLFYLLGLIFSPLGHIGLPLWGSIFLWAAVFWRLYFAPPSDTHNISKT